MLKIYGGDLSYFCNKVRFAANAMDLKYEYIKINFKAKEHKTPDFIKMHPAGKIPVIDDCGFFVFESNAIIKYLAVKHQSGLYPKDLIPRTRVDQWMDFCTLHIGCAMDKVLFNSIFAPRIPVPVDGGAIKQGRVFLDRYLPLVEQQLNEFDHIASNEITLADINLLAILDPCEVACVDVKRYTRITAWREKLKHQEFYTRCHKEYGQVLKRLH